ncbi:hypothetical protein [Ramlibacter alkalitolerans]|nr:hypothetical protein [Ramlibacter alkalitolerans]
MIQALVGQGLLALVLSSPGLLPAAHAASATPLGAAKLADLRGERASPDVRHIADWAVDSGDPGGLPFVIVDKKDSRVFVFDAAGQLRGASPALVGAAHGDDSVPGIGQRAIASIQPQERTTPAGRFSAVMGFGPKGEDILWVDYDSAVALHRVVTHNPQERRLQRLASKVAAERRITYGCINVPVSFYDDVVRPTFSGTRGIVYILPESRPAQELFGSYDVRHQVSHASGMTQVSAH